MSNPNLWEEGNPLSHPPTLLSNTSVIAFVISRKMEAFLSPPAPADTSDSASAAGVPDAMLEWHDGIPGSNSPDDDKVPDLVPPATWKNSSGAYAFCQGKDSLPSDDLVSSAPVPAPAPTSDSASDSAST
jgi:hypothetical protein